MPGRRRSIRRIVAWAMGAVIAVPVAALLVAVTLTLRTLPTTEGELSIPGVRQAVSVTRDGRGVPQIAARDRHDLYLALGFVHAQDRLFQMDLERRLGAGRLSEVLGARTVDVDLKMRTLGLDLLASGDVDRQGSEFQSVLADYAAGVNAYIATAKALPIEFSVLGYKPEPWRAADSLVIGKLIQFQLSGNYGKERLVETLSKVLSKRDIESLFSIEQQGEVREGRDARRPHEVDMASAAAGGTWPNDDAQYASNNWVVSGSRTVNGKPILANDPHLDYSVPLTWYLADLRSPDIHVAGATIPGMPIVALGHNDRIAWGYTVTTADVEDVFVEKSPPKDPSVYATSSGLQPFATRSTTIKVAKQADVVRTIRTTYHGPVVEEDPPSSRELDDGRALALEATFLTPGDRSIEAQWLVDRAANWTEWRDALRMFVGPPLNMVYADIDGHIGFTVAGLVPIRRHGDGAAPVDGATGDYDWTGAIPFERLPSEFDPPRGWIATANNKIVGRDYPYFISNDWDMPFRIDRIARELALPVKQSLATSSALQLDDVSLAARSLLPTMLRGLVAEDDAQGAAIHDLEVWDDRMTPDAAQPLVFSAWVRAFNQLVFRQRLDGGKDVSFIPSIAFTVNVLENADHWCTSARCSRELRQTFSSAIASLTQRYGSSVHSWRWGDAHRMRFDHPIFHQIPVLDMLADRHWPAPGSIDTVNAGAFRPGDPSAPFADAHGPGLRAVYDLSRLDRSTYQLALGQSGQILSRHYDDFHRSWIEGVGNEIGSGGGSERLWLKPASQ